MTEGEFQEFIITVGYRYHAKTKEAFNTLEGFHTVVAFDEPGGKYSFVLRASAENLPELLKMLSDFSSHHKDFIGRIGWKDRRVFVTVKMTIDSDIDRESLRETVRFFTTLCKSGALAPICAVCSGSFETGLYVVGTGIVPMCAKCLHKKQLQYEKRRDAFEKKQQHLPAGLAGALFGAALGASLYVLLYQFGALFGLWSCLIAVFSFSGFVVCGQRATRKSAVLTALISLLAFAAAEYAALVAAMSIQIERDGGGIAVTEAIRATNECFLDGGFLTSILIEIAAGAAAIAAVGGLYFLKRSMTRPLKISRNLL